MQKNKILITGGSGFIGTNAVNYFIDCGYEILNVDIKKPMNPLNVDTWCKHDILEYNELRKIVDNFKPDYLIHLAARTDLKETKNLLGYASNIDGVRNVIDSIKLCGTVRRAIFASSRMVCRIDYQPRDEFDICPPNLYGESKATGERIVRDSKLEAEWMIVRPTSIWGPWFDVPYRIFFDTIQKSLYFHPGNHNPKKSFGYIGNTLHQLDRLLHTGSDAVNGKTFYLCDYPPLYLKEWSNMIAREMGKKIRTLPITILQMIGIIGDKLTKLGWYRVPLTTFRLNNLITEMIYDTSGLESICGKLPYDLHTGVRTTVEWIDNFRK